MHGKKPALLDLPLSSLLQVQPTEPKENREEGLNFLNPCFAVYSILLRLEDEMILIGREIDFLFDLTRDDLRS